MLVTGAAGFLASYLVDTVATANRIGLLAKPCKLTLLLRTMPHDGHRLAHLDGGPDVEFLQADVNQAYVLDKGLTHIVHAASAASPIAFREDPFGTVDANTVGLRRLLEHAATSDVRSMLFFSSSEVYGDPPADELPTREDSPCRTGFTGPRARYAESKRFGETLADLFHEVASVPIKVVRPFHVHGPGLRLDDGRIVAELIRQGLRERRLHLLSDGRATRCYGYAADATLGFLLALLSDHEGMAFNIGADQPETTILELASAIASILGLEPPLPARTPLPAYLQGAPARSRPDLTRARDLLGYAPWTSLEAGLERTIAWQRAQGAGRGV